MKTPTCSRNLNRRGAAAVLILLLTTILFMAVVFSIDIARIQLAQVELQSSADLAARAGAEAMSRSVGSATNHSLTDTLLRAEIDMVAQLNTVAGQPLVLNTATEIQFGKGEKNEITNTVDFVAGPGGSVDATTDAVTVIPNIENFPVVFGAFMSNETVGLAETASAMVSERDMVMVLDRSTSMLTFDAGTIDIADYDTGLYQLEDDLYNSNDAHYPDTEFRVSGSTLELSRMQALKLAVLKFREEIDNSRGFEQLGLTTYSVVADDPVDGVKLTSGATSVSTTTIPTTERNLLVGSGETLGTESYASALEDHTTNYVNFDLNYMGMRRLGSTNIVAGIEKGVEILFGPGRRTFATPVLILMTDGRHNQDGDPIVTATDVKTAHPELLIYTVTFGDGADQAPMATIAAIGDGEHHHATDVNSLVIIFKDLANGAGVTLIK